MAGANQLKLLIKNYINKNSRKFLTTVLQITVHEAKIGYANVTDKLWILVETVKSTSFDTESDNFPRILSSSTAITSHSSTIVKMG